MKFRFDAKIAAAVAEETNLPFATAENKFEALVYLYNFSPLYLVCNMSFHYLSFFKFMLPMQQNIFFFCRLLMMLLLKLVVPLTLLRLL